MAVVCKAVKQRSRHLCVAEHVRPFSKAQIGRNENACSLVKLGEQMKQQCASRLCEREIAQFVQNDGIDIHKAVGQLPGFAGDLLRLKLVHELNRGKEPNSFSMVLYRLNANGRRKMRFPCAGPTDEHHVLRGLAESDRMTFSHESLIDGAQGNARQPSGS